MFSKCANYVGSYLPFATNSFLKKAIRYNSGYNGRNKDRYNSRKNCPEITEPRCDMNDPNVCEGREETLTKKFLRATYPETGMWKYPECCGRTCDNLQIRMDELCYQSSDKKREYTQTWVPCPPLQIIEVEMCSNDIPTKPMPTRPRRTKAEYPPKKGADHQACKPACKMANKYRWLMPCKGVLPNPKKVRMPCCYKAEGCEMARTIPTCQLSMEPFPRCKKEPAPYPSYSECQKICKWDTSLDPHCTTSRQIERCAAWQEFKRRLTLPPPPDIGREPDPDKI